MRAALPEVLLFVLIFSGSWLQKPIRINRASMNRVLFATAGRAGRVRARALSSYLGPADAPTWSLRDSFCPTSHQPFSKPEVRFCNRRCWCVTCSQTLALYCL